MSTAPEAPAGGVSSAKGAGERFQSCRSCRLLSGGGLILSAAYVFMAARRYPTHGGASMAMWTQMVFASCLASLGVVVMMPDPVQKKDRKSA